MAFLKRDGKYVVEEIESLILSEIDHDPTLDSIGAIVQLLHTKYQIPENASINALQQLRAQEKIDFLQSIPNTRPLTATSSIRGFSWFSQTNSGRESFIVFMILLASLIIYLGIPVDHPLRIISQIPLGFSLTLFLPGFTFYSTLFPKRLRFLNLERLIFSVGLSVIVTPLISIILNVTPQGITQLSITLALIGFSLLMNTLTSIQKYRHQ